MENSSDRTTRRDETTTPRNSKIDNQYVMKDGEIVHNDGTTIPADEPTYLFRALDQYSLQRLNGYLKDCSEAGSEPMFLRSIQTAIDEFTAYRAEHADEVQVPKKAS